MDVWQVTRLGPDRHRDDRPDAEMGSAQRGAAGLAARQHGQLAAQQVQFGVQPTDLTQAGSTACCPAADKPMPVMAPPPSAVGMPAVTGALRTRYTAANSLVMSLESAGDSALTAIQSGTQQFVANHAAGRQ